MATAILMVESGETVFGNGVVHDRLLEKSQDVRSLHGEVEAVASGAFDMAQTKLPRFWVQLQ